MVDESAFKRILVSANPQPCPFGRARLSGCCACSLVGRHYIAERETMVCSAAAAHAACAGLHELLRRKSAFAIKASHQSPRITHAQNMKIQCGGLHGLQLEVDGCSSVEDVAALVAAARLKFGEAERFPYTHIMRAVVAYQPRKQHGRE
jgi:hypothetical protein